MFRVILKVADSSLGNLMRLLMTEKYITIEEAFYHVGDGIEGMPISFGYTPEGLTVLKEPNSTEQARSELGLGKSKMERKPPLKKRRAAVKDKAKPSDYNHAVLMKTVIEQNVKPGGTFAPADVRSTARIAGLYSKNAFYSALKALVESGVLVKLDYGRYQRPKD